MTDAPPPSPPGADALPQALPEPEVRRKNPLRLSLVWVVPIVAVLVGASLLVRTLLEAGPRVVISFRTAEGLEPGKTEVRYKEVMVGRVDKVTLSDDRQRVLAEVQLSSSAAGIAVEDSSFWVVRPRIGAAGVSGLNTLFSGAYIGVDAGVSTASRRHFEGLEAPPHVLRGEPGRIFVLTAQDLGSLGVGSPVYYRRIGVGRVVGYTLDPQRDALSVQIFIEAPYDRLVTPHARFWNASGLNLTLNADGLTLNAQTVASVLAGGVAFERLPGSATAPAAEAGRSFQLFDDRHAALAPPDGAPLRIRMVFEQSVRGLAVGSPVDFLGVELGTVRSFGVVRDRPRRRFAVEVVADIYPLRVGAVRDALAPQPTADLAGDIAFLRRLVEHGLRGQLRTGNLLTGQLYVALDFIPKAAPAALAADNGGVTVPTVPGTLADVQPQIAEIVSKLSKVPFEEIGHDLRGALGQASSAIRQLTPEAQLALAQVQRTLTAVQESLARLDRNLLDRSAPVQRNVEHTLNELQRAAQSLRALGDYLQRHPEAVLRGKPADPALPGGEPR